MSWPSELSVFSDVAAKYFSDADESGLQAAAERHKASLAALRDALDDAKEGYDQLVGAWQVDEKSSDAQGSVQSRRLDFLRKAGALAAKAQAGQDFMEQAAPVITASKTADQQAGHDALQIVQQSQYIPDWALHAVGQETNLEQAKAQLDQKMSANMNDRVGKLQNTYQAPADGDYDFDGQPTNWDGGGGMRSSVDSRHEQGSSVEGITTSPTERRQQTESTGGMVSSGAAGQQQDDATNAGMQAQQSATSDQSPASSEQNTSAPAPAGPAAGNPSSSRQPQGGTPNAPQAGATSTMRGGGVEHAPQPTTGAGADGGPPPPTIAAADFGGGPGAGQSPARGADAGRINSGPEAPRTTASSSTATDKPAAGSPGSGSQSAGLRSNIPAGQGAAGGETRAQGAAAPGYRQATVGDTAAGAGRAADRLAGQQNALGTGQGAGTALAAATLAPLAASTSAMHAAYGALPGAICDRDPLLSLEQAELRAHGGLLVVGGTVKGFGADGVTWGDNPVADTTATPVGLLLMAYEDDTVEPNPEAGIYRRVLLEATSTEDFGAIRPEMELPEGVPAMARGQNSQAPAQTWLISHPGVLAVELVKWRLEQHAKGSKWRPVAVGFLHEADPETTHALAQLGVEAYWEGRQGFQLANDETTEQTKDATAQLDGAAKSSPDPEADAKRTDPLAHAKAAERRDPGGVYDPAGLAAKEAGWYQSCCANTHRARLTNARWVLELADRYKQERDGGEPTLNW